MLLYQEDPGLIAAKAEARKTLGTFFQSYKNQRAGRYSVKFPLTTSQGTEHIWLQIDRVNGDRIDGRIANQPVGPEYFFGQSMTVNRSEISDWMIRTPEGIHGAYTTRYALKFMSPEEREAVEALFLP